MCWRGGAGKYTGIVLKERECAFTSFNKRFLSDMLETNRDSTIFVDGREHGWRRTGLCEGCVMLVKHKPGVGDEGDAPAGVEDGGAEAGEARSGLKRAVVCVEHARSVVM